MREKIKTIGDVDVFRMFAAILLALGIVLGVSFIQGKEVVFAGSMIQGYLLVCAGGAFAILYLTQWLRSLMRKQKH